MDTLVNLMVWGVKKPVRERKAAVVDAILVEASIWGPEVFKWYFRCLRLSLGYTKEFGIKVASYEAYLARMAGNDRV
jgi:hypothetical protein